MADSGEIVLIFICATVPAIPGLMRIACSADIFDPLALLSLVYLASVPISTILLLLLGKLRDLSLVDMYYAWLYLGISMAVISGVFCCVVAQRRGGKTQSYHPVIPVTNNVVGRAIVLYWASVFLRILTLPLGYGTWLVDEQVEPSSNILGSLGTLHRINYILILATSSWNPQVKPCFLAFTGPIVAELVIGMLEGSKAAAIYSLLPVAFFLKRRTPSAWARKKQLALITIGTIITVIIFPLVNAFRSTGAFALVPVSFDDLACALAERISWLPSVTRILSSVPDVIPYWYGKSLWPALLWFVPRVWWKDKPLLSIGSWYAQTILGWDPESNSEAAITIWGDAYLNFGLLGIIVMSIFMGAIYGYMYLRWYLGARRAFDHVVYWFFISSFILAAERNIAVLVAGFSQNVLVASLMWIIARLTFRSKVPTEHDNNRTCSG